MSDCLHFRAPQACSDRVADFNVKPEIILWKIRIAVTPGKVFTPTFLFVSLFHTNVCLQFPRGTCHELQGVVGLLFPLS